MDRILTSLVEGVTDAKALAGKLSELGKRSVQGIVEKTSIYSALTVSSEDVEHDEIHYLLVPLLSNAGDYAVYHKRVLPEGVGASNPLPKKRVFHLPDESAIEIIEKQIVSDTVDKKSGDDEGSSELADVLDTFASAIDRETNKISGGLLIIGGAVAIINPVVGVGIAVKGLLPSVGAKASKLGTEYIGGKLRGWNKSSKLAGHEKSAKKELRKLKAEVYTNPILRSIEAIAANPETDFDPSSDSQNWVDEFESAYYYTLTIEAVGEVYSESISKLERLGFQKFHIEWIKSMKN